MLRNKAVFAAAPASSTFVTPENFALPAIDSKTLLYSKFDKENGAAEFGMNMRGVDYVR